MAAYKQKHTPMMYFRLDRSIWSKVTTPSVFKSVRLDLGRSRSSGDSLIVTLLVKLFSCSLCGIDIILDDSTWPFLVNKNEGWTASTSPNTNKLF